MKRSELKIPFVWKDRHSVLLDRCLYIPDHYSDHSKWEKISWEDPRMFGNKKPVSIEYCSGNGQWICQKAKENPGHNWVAVEKRFDRARKIWGSLKRENLSNVFVVCGEATVFSLFYAPCNSVDQIFVNFPDPWPKLRHAKHRLIQTHFLDAVQQVLVPRGKALFTTDDKIYLEQMIEVVRSHPTWVTSLEEPYFELDHPYFGDSYFATLWKSKGRLIYHFPCEVVG
jgi:tRNA (guanine-N7-)-methyltransferase